MYCSVVYMDHTYKSFTKSDYNIINNAIIANTPENNYIGNLHHNADTFLMTDNTNNITQILYNSISYYSYRLYQYLMVILIELLFVAFLWFLVYWFVLRQYNCIREMFETI